MRSDNYILHPTIEVDKIIKIYMDPECLRDSTLQGSNRIISQKLIAPFRTFTNNLKIRMSISTIKI